MGNTLVAVVVTYNPVLSELLKNLHHYAGACNFIVVVDNSKNRVVEKAMSSTKIKVLSMEENIGIAAAQNVGIRYGQSKLQADYFIFFDQDSYLDSIAVLKLLEHFKSQRELNKVGVLAPGNGSEKSCFVECTEVISSGSLIGNEIFKRVGLFESGLFIDFVDYEFCWRVRSNKMKVLVDNSISLNHQTGEVLRRVGKIVSSPFRNYYVYRNIIVLMKSDQVEMSAVTKRLWKFRMAKRMVFELVFCPERITRLRYIIHGIHDGFSGVLGKMEM